MRDGQGEERDDESTDEPHGATGEVGGGRIAIERGGAGLERPGVGAPEGSQRSVPLARARVPLAVPSRVSPESLLSELARSKSESASTPSAPAAPGLGNGSLAVSAGSLETGDGDETCLSPLPPLRAVRGSGETSADWLRVNGPVVLGRAYEIAFSPKGDKSLRSLLVRGVLEIEAEKVRALGKMGAAGEQAKGAIESARLLETAARVSAMSPAELMARQRSMRASPVQEVSVQ